MYSYAIITFFLCQQTTALYAYETNILYLVQTSGPVTDIFK